MTLSPRAEVAWLLEYRVKRESWKLFSRLYPEEDTTRPDGTVYHARHKYPRHMEFFEAGKRYRERCFLAANRVGKALRNGTPVATPNGWRPIEALRVGDKVVAGDGSITTVTGVYPQGVKPLYRLTFDVGETVDCCAEHLWRYQHPRSRYPYRQSHGRREENPFYGEWRTADTATILRQVGARPIPRRRVVMPTSQPWKLQPRPVSINPYLLGYLLGDGHLRNGAITFSTADEELVQAVCSVLPIGCFVRYLGRYDYRIMSSIERRTGAGGRYVATHPLMIGLLALGVYGLRSSDKRIPPDYLLNEPSVRLAVLQGLMDTDGSITATGAMEFSSVSRRLADDVTFLVHSLGGKASLEGRQTHYSYLGERRAGQPSYRVRIRLNVCPFRLARKAERWNTRHNTPNRVLHSIEPTEPGEATCISVAHPDRTYVTAHGIVTHNTLGGGGYELTAHLTGLYPAWWKGRRFSRPIRAWAAGKTNETTRDIVQTTLLGEIAHEGQRKVVSGTGLVPGNLLAAPAWKQGVADLVDTIKVKHVAGGWSLLGLKSYQQGRGSFEGTSQHVIWLDEECPMDVYGECLIRTATAHGIVMLTFTPIDGLSEVVLQFLPAEMRPAA